MRFLITLILMTFQVNSYAKGSKYWLENYSDIVNQQFICTSASPINDRSPCNYFVANVLYIGFELSDFINNDNVMSAEQIFNYVRSEQQWKLLGSADQQAALEIAQSKANLGYPVIAVENSHIAIIVPGQMSRSSSWKLNVPNSASFMLDDVSRSYSSKPLSFAWKSTDKYKIQLYWREF